MIRIVSWASLEILGTVFDHFGLFLLFLLVTRYETYYCICKDLGLALVKVAIPNTRHMDIVMPNLGYGLYVVIIKRYFAVYTTIRNKELRRKLNKYLCKRKRFLTKFVYI